MRQEDILNILANLSDQGYSRFEFLQFYLSIRKKSRLIERFANNDSSPFFKIYKTV